MITAKQARNLTPNSNLIEPYAIIAAKLIKEAAAENKYDVKMEFKPATHRAEAIHHFGRKLIDLGYEVELEDAAIDIILHISWYGQDIEYRF